MRNKTYGLLLILVLAFNANAQEWQAVDTISLKERVTSYSIDNQNQLYVGTISGNLYRYEGKDQSEFYSAIANFKLTSVEAWNRMKVFLFYRNPQEFYYLDRFNTVSNSYDLSEYSDELVYECTPGVDNSLWVLTSSYNELRKYNLQTKRLLFANPLDIDVENVTHIRAYQNLVIISDREEGIYIFDQFGNLLTELEYANVNHFQIEAGKLLFHCDEGIIKLDPFNPNDAETTKAPDGAFDGLVKGDSSYYFCKKSQILVFRRL